MKESFHQGGLGMCDVREIELLLGEVSYRKLRVEEIIYLDSQIQEQLALSSSVLGARTLCIKY